MSTVYGHSSLCLVAGYYNENGIIERDKNQEWDSSLKVSRYTVRSNVDVNVTPTTLFRANVGVFLQTRNAPPGDTETNQAFSIKPCVYLLTCIRPSMPMDAFPV